MFIIISAVFVCVSAFIIYISFWTAIREPEEDDEEDDEKPAVDSNGNLIMEEQGEI